ncbi:hypothetical protein G6F57_020772 [Rhizopus arrhizus]|nr:hypothetical protein G6F32_014892 [Rhizopus arrhizus]KAG1436201.1 hypothetical protein G6F57_020772 [Rhizopus arrhizus]
MPRLPPGAGGAVDHLGAPAPVALRPPVPRSVAGRLHPDAAGHGRYPGAAVPDHAADGRRADPVPERFAHRLQQGPPVPGRPAGVRLPGLGPGMGPHLHPGLGQRTHRRRPAYDHL